MRIVSLVPAATEMLFTLGPGDDVVGVAHECDYPVEALRLHALGPGPMGEPMDPTARALPVEFGPEIVL